VLQFKNPWLAYFAAANALLAVLITASIVPGDQLFSLSTGSLFLGLALPGHFFFFALLLFIPLSIAEKLLQPGQRLLIPVATLYSLFVLAIFINARVFELYRFHLNGMVVSLITSGEAMQIMSIAWSTWLSLGAGFAVLFAVELWLARASFRYFTGRGHKTRYLWIFVASFMVVGQVFYAYSEIRGDRAVTSMVRYIPWALPLTAKSNIRALGIAVANDGSSDLGRMTGSSLNYPKKRLQCEPNQSAGLNVVMLVVDSLRFDALNDQVMPNTFGLEDSSRVFNDHFSTGNATRFGIFGLLYGLPGSYWHAMVGEQRGSVLFDVLVKQEYQLFIDASASWSFPEFDRTVFVSVRDRIVSGSTLQALNPNDKRHTDSIVTDDITRKIINRNTEKPFFSLLFLDAPHSFSQDSSAASPFQPALENVRYLDLDNDFEPTEFLNLYKNSVYYDDTLIGQVIETLKQQSLLDETVLIITGDHSQEFNDLRQNYWGHNSNFSKYQTRVPMLIRWPGLSADKVSRRTNHEDIVPTLMRRVLGCENPVDDYSTGQDLYAPAYRSKPLLIESWSTRALMTDDRIFVYGSSGDSRVFDLDYNELPDGVTDTRAILEAMNSMGAFFR
jgi:hypothetical protein